MKETWFSIAKADVFISHSHKDIEKVKDIVFEDNIIDLISLLEIIDAGYSIKECDFISYKKALDVLSHSYSDKYFQRVVKLYDISFQQLRR